MLMYDLRYCCAVAVSGSCRPFRRLTLLRHVYELEGDDNETDTEGGDSETGMAGVKREFLCCACIST